MSTKKYVVFEVEIRKHFYFQCFICLLQIFIKRILVECCFWIFQDYVDKKLNNLDFFSDIGVSEGDKQTIVNKHNELRKLIANGQVQGQPRGVNLKRLVRCCLPCKRIVSTAYLKVR